MRGSALPSLAALLLLACSTVAPAQDPVPAALRDCQKRLDPELDVGFERVAARCPGLVRALERSPWAGWLPQSWRDPHNDLSAGSLAELGGLLESERELPRLRAAPAPAALAPVLAELGSPERERASLWGRLRDWLRSVFDPGQSPPEEAWLAQLLRRLGPSETLMRAIGYAAIALVLALAAFIVASELRAAGLLRTRRPARRPPRVAVPGVLRRPGWREIEQAPLAERPALALGLVLEALVQTRRLPPAGSLTAAELVARAELIGPQERERLATLARVAEQARFGPRLPAPPRLAAAVAEGRALLEGLGLAGRVAA